MVLSMAFLDLIKRLPVDLGQGTYRHRTKAKSIAFSLAKQGKGRAALDVGCGDGFWSKRLKENGWLVTSIDGYDLRYKPAKEVNLEKPMPFEDNSFDLIWKSEVIEHIHNVDQVLSELRRILKPGGRMILTTPNSYFWLYDLLKIFGISPAKVQNPDHKQFFSLKDMKRLFPTARLYGFFPYAVVKMRIKDGIGPLSPTFIIHEKNPDPTPTTNQADSSKA